MGSEEDRITDASQNSRRPTTRVRAVIDPTVVGLGRYIPRIQTIAEQVPLNIVVATGVHVPRCRLATSGGPALNELVGAEAPRSDGRDVHR